MGVVNREEEIRAMNISKTYTRGGKPVSALKPLNLEVYTGEFMVILGPSGSGKSTLLNLLSGLSAPSTGQVRFREVILGDLSSVELAQLRRFQMGFVFQQFYLLQHLTALENVLVPLTFKTHLTMKEQQERAAEVLDSVGLSHRLHHMKWTPMSRHDFGFLKQRLGSRRPLGQPRNRTQRECCSSGTGAAASCYRGL